MFAVFLLSAASDAVLRVIALMGQYGPASFLMYRRGFSMAFGTDLGNHIARLAVIGATPATSGILATTSPHYASAGGVAGRHLMPSMAAAGLMSYMIRLLSR